MSNELERENLGISAQGIDLPIVRSKQEIKETLGTSDTLIVIGETGSGKTTQLPIIIKESLRPGQEIAVTQPRRVAATSVARYVAESTGSRLGQDIGYTIRFDDQTTEGTQVNFMTDGILIRKIQGDPLLSNYDVVMVDEVHERSKNIDFSLGLLKDIQKKRKKQGNPLKLVVASATLEKQKLIDYFDNAPAIEVPGRPYPVDVHYRDQNPTDIEDVPGIAAQTTMGILSSGKEGDVLIFMPGREEIDATAKMIEDLAKGSRTLESFDVLPLYGTQSPEEQDRIFAPSRKRKVIVSTNVAETSITIPGVRHVVDSGLIKQIEFNAESGIEALVTVEHAKSGCIQRAGRAGRVAPGDCYRLYTEESFNNRREFQLPEIQRSNLSHVVLQMKKIGIDDVAGFDFIDPPDHETVLSAIQSLTLLGAFDENGELTEIGHTMAELPLEPHIARMVIESEKYGCVEEVATIASFLGARPVFVRPKEEEMRADREHMKYKVKTSDFLTLLNVWRAYEETNYDGRWARDNYLNARVLREVDQVRSQLLNVLQRNGIDLSGGEHVTNDVISKSIASGLVENIMSFHGFHQYKKIDGNSQGYYIHPGSAVAYGKYEEPPSFIVAGQIVETTRTYARNCQVVKPEWLIDIAPHLVTEKKGEPTYNRFDDSFSIPIETYIKGSSYPIHHGEKKIDGNEAHVAFITAIANGTIHLPSIDANRAVLQKMDDLQVRSGGVVRGQLTIDELSQFYNSRLGHVASVKELVEYVAEHDIDLRINIDDFITPNDQEKVILDNPDKLQIGDSSYQVSYARSYGYRGDDEFYASITLPASKIFELTELPHLPSNRKLRIGIEGQKYVSVATDVSLDKMRIDAADIVNTQAWMDWQLDNPKHSVSAESMDDENLRKPIKYGEDPITGSYLYAYPVVVVDAIYGSRYSLEYFRTEGEAESARERAKRMLELAKSREERFPTVPTFQGRFSTSRYRATSRRPETEGEKPTLLGLAEQDTDSMLSEVKELMSRDSKPRRRALLETVLLGRGPDVLDQIKIPEAEFEQILEQLRQLKIERSKSYTSYFSRGSSDVDEGVKNVKSMQLVISAAESTDVKDYIGEDRASISKFKNLLWEKLKVESEVPDDNFVKLATLQILEEMTS